MQIFFASIICYFFLKRAIYLHHKLSLVLVILSIVGVVLLEFFREGVETKTLIIIIMILLVGFIIKSFADCSDQYLMDVYYCSQFKLLFIEGISATVFTIIYFIIIKFSPIGKLIGYNNFNFGEHVLLLVLFSLLYCIFSGLLNAYRLTVIMKLSPMNRTTSDSFVAPFLIIYSIIFNFCVDKGPEKYWIVINIIFASIIIFCCLVYNEILILRCCDLDKNTYAEIVFRSYSEDLLNYDYRSTVDNEDPIYNLGDENDE